MSNMSVADILKIYGTWIGSSQFTELVAKQHKISNRQAYRLIKGDKQILKLVLQDRKVLYGLAEFGLPKTGLSTEKPSMLNLFSYRKWKIEHDEAKREKELTKLECELDAIEEIALLGDEDAPEFWNKSKAIEEKYRKKARALSGLPQ